jgi:hypothetical protein
VPFGHRKRLLKARQRHRSDRLFFVSEPRQPSSANSAAASFRSSVSKPSVNKP